MAMGKIGASTSGRLELYYLATGKGKAYIGEQYLAVGKRKPLTIHNRDNGSLYLVRSLLDAQTKARELQATLSDGATVRIRTLHREATEKESKANKLS